MKKSLLLGMLFLAPLLMNRTRRRSWHKGGANFANQDVSDIHISSATDFHFGAYVNINYLINSGIKPQVLYSAYARNWDNVKVDFYYISIPSCCASSLFITQALKLVLSSVSEQG